ncbi:hypothetical protein [Nocardia sp. NBC_00416]|uniref:hypothetical protein n=1 Tax=Nocardia sp. NBC_00416 TaxID=2975991 RepID=UPI002E220C80
MAKVHRRRTLTVDAQQYVWANYHQHVNGCAEILRLRRRGAAAGLTLIFRPDGERLVSDGGPIATGLVWIGDRLLNLNKPGVVRAFVDAAADAGWLTEAHAVGRRDGWVLFDDAYARNTGRESPP